MTFEKWKIEVIRLCLAEGWSEDAISSFDWDAWKEMQFDEGLSPREAVDYEIEAGL